MALFLMVTLFMAPASAMNARQAAQAAQLEMEDALFKYERREITYIELRQQFVAMRLQLSDMQARDFGQQVNDAKKNADEHGWYLPAATDKAADRRELIKNGIFASLGRNGPQTRFELVGPRIEVSPTGQLTASQQFFDTKKKTILSGYEVYEMKNPDQENERYILRFAQTSQEESQKEGWSHRTCAHIMPTHIALLRANEANPTLVADTFKTATEFGIVGANFPALEGRFGSCPYVAYMTRKAAGYDYQKNDMLAAETAVFKPNMREAANHPEGKTALRPDGKRTPQEKVEFVMRQLFEEFGNYADYRIVSAQLGMWWYDAAKPSAWRAEPGKAHAYLVLKISNGADERWALVETGIKLNLTVVPTKENAVELTSAMRCQFTVGEVTQGMWEELPAWTADAHPDMLPRYFCEIFPGMAQHSLHTHDNQVWNCQSYVKRVWDDITAGWNPHQWTSTFDDDRTPSERRMGALLPHVPQNTRYLRSYSRALASDGIPLVIYPLGEYDTSQHARDAMATLWLQQLRDALDA